MTVATTFRALQAEVLRRARRGETLDQIDERAIEPAEVPEDEKAAAWIVARAELARLAGGYDARQDAVRRRARGLTPVGTD